MLHHDLPGQPDSIDADCPGTVRSGSEKDIAGMQQHVLDTPTIRRCSPALGAEVIGLDVAQPLDRRLLDWLRAALQEHHLLCLRDQQLTEAQQIAFSELLGPLETFPEKDKTKSESTIYHVANV